MRISSNWKPTQYDSITLTFDGRYWIEVGRSDISSGTSPFNPDIVSPSNAQTLLYVSADGECENKSFSGAFTVASSGAATLADSVVTNAKVSASAAIQFSKLEPLASGRIVVGSAGEVPTAVQMSGDATMADTGALTIAASAVTYSKLSKDVLRTVTVDLDYSDIVDLFATPITLLPSPSSGYFYYVESAEIFYHCGTTSFATIGFLKISYVGGDDIIAFPGALITVGMGANSYNIGSPSVYDVNTSGAQSGVDLLTETDLGIQISATSAVTLGSNDNYAKVRLVYREVQALS